MSIDRCKSCSEALDTDDVPHVYRELMDDECLCDTCYESKLSEDAEMLLQEYHDRLQEKREEIKGLRLLVDSYKNLYEQLSESVKKFASVTGT